MQPIPLCPITVRNETIAEHDASHAGEYDAACAFHVIEHVAAALAWGWLASRAGDALFRVPASAEPSGLLPVACKRS
jgi:hypothetical protein